MDWIPILLLIPAYLIAREAVQGWRALFILIALTSLIIFLAIVTGLDPEGTWTYSAGPPFKISFKATYLAHGAVIAASVLMLVFQRFAERRTANTPNTNIRGATPTLK